MLPKAITLLSVVSYHLLLWVLCFLIHLTSFSYAATSQMKSTPVILSKGSKGVKQQFFAHSVQSLGDKKKQVSAYNSSRFFIKGSTLYTGLQNGSVIAYDLKHLKVIWKLNLESPVTGSVITDGKNLFVGTAKGKVRAFSLSSLQNKPGEYGEIKSDISPLWVFSMPDSMVGTPIFVDQMIVYTTNGHQVYALNKKTGKKIWRFKKDVLNEITIKGQSSPVLIQGEIFIGFADGSLVTLNPSDGKVNWKKQIGNTVARYHDVDATPIVYKNYIYTSSYDGSIVALDLLSKKVIWKNKDFGTFSKIAIAPDGNNLFLSTVSGNIIALDSKTGKQIWKQTLKSGVGREITCFGEFLAFGTTQKGIHILNKSNGDIIWSHELETGVGGRPVVYQDKVFFLSNYSNLYIVQGFSEN